MKYCIPLQENSLESKMDSRFGRAPFFLFFDEDSEESEIVENKNTADPSGVGVASAQLLVDRGVKTVITAKVGPKAGGVLDAAGIKVITEASPSATAAELIEKIKAGEFSG